MLQKILNVGTNSLRRKNFSVMLDKVIIRMKEQKLKNTGQDVLAWCKQQARSSEDVLKKIDPILWQETLSACQDIERNAQKKKLATLGLDLGGGGHYPLLYFLTRRFKPRCVVETGVAAGWSSQAILTALRKNGEMGCLYSSDFPYFRYDNPEKLVGYVVDSDLKDRWDLYIDGDRNNLPAIITKIDKIDLFHYDSDKSYIGRSFALDTVQPKLTNESVVIFDDIQDNAHFMDYVEQTKRPYAVFGFNGKYLGIAATFLDRI